MKSVILFLVGFFSIYESKKTLTNANNSRDSILPLCKLNIDDHWPILSTIRVSDFTFWLGSIFIKIGEAFEAKEYYES